MIKCWDCGTEEYHCTYYIRPVLSAVSPTHPKSFSPNLRPFEWCVCFTCPRYVRIVNNWMSLYRIPLSLLPTPHPRLPLTLPSPHPRLSLCDLIASILHQAAVIWQDLSQLCTQCANTHAHAHGCMQTHREPLMLNYIPVCAHRHSSEDTAVTLVNVLHWVHMETEEEVTDSWSIQWGPLSC